MAPCQMVNNMIKVKKQALELRSFLLKIEIILWINIVQNNTKNSKNKSHEYGAIPLLFAFDWYLSIGRYNEEIYRKQERAFTVPLIQQRH